jgi:threonine dehydratase
MRLIRNSSLSPPHEPMDRLTPTDVQDAATILRSFVRRSPVLTSSLINDEIGAHLYCKAECLQVTGSFKARGAFNKLLNMSREHRRRGVVAFSAGNHAQALAYASRVLEVDCTIFMPSDAPETKIAKTRQYGATVLLYDRLAEDREVLLDEFAIRTEATPIRPYDDYAVMAGGGTAALEFVEQLREDGVELDILLVPCGGGGLVAGCATVLKKLSPSTEVFSVEPDAFDDTARSLERGERTKQSAVGHSICDALLTVIPGSLTFPINQCLLAGAVSVTDAAAAAAMRLAFRHLQVVLEPGAAVALAAACAWGLDDVKNIGVILSGGNVDSAVFVDVLR